MEIAAREGDLSHVLTGMRRLWNPLAAEKGLELTVAVDTSVPELSLFDPLRVRQCISNLVSNAIKFTEAGQVQIRLSADTVEDGHNLVTVCVSDTGIGMRADVLEDVFVPFSQAEKSTSRDYGGTGLGLSISRKLARLMGGDLSVTSKPGQGSEFCLTFLTEPIEMETTGYTDCSSAADTGAQVSSYGSQRRVLIVDDRPMNIMVARLLLKAHGIESTEASGGLEALDLLAGETFDLVLLDMHMPVMDGPETFRKIRASGEPWSDIPVIALTADAMSGNKESFLELGMNGYVSKPIDQIALISEVNRLSGSMSDESLMRAI